MKQGLYAAFVLAGMLGLANAQIAVETSAVNESAPRFAAPEALTTEAAAFAKMYYPSPVLQDLNGDGKVELVLGDLMGNLMQSSAIKGSPLAWSKPEPLKNGEGPIRLNNW